MKKIIAAVAAATLTAAGVTACGDPAPSDRAAVCITKIGHRRLPDAQCQQASDNTGALLWLYYNATSRQIPAIGSYAKGGTTVSPPTGVYVIKGVTATGGAVEQEPVNNLVPEEEQQPPAPVEEEPVEEPAPAPAPVEEGE